MVTLSTKFAKPDLASEVTLNKQVDLLRNTPLFSQLFNSVNEIVVILNKERQVVYANNSLLTMLKLKSSKSIFGKRPGELLGCIHATEESGCGTTEFCRVCGAIRAILKSQLGQNWTDECRIITKKPGGDLNLLVKTTPLVLKQYKFTIFTIKDISDEKRRRILEKIFFHDVLNTITRLKIASTLLERKKHVEKASKIVSRAVNELKDSIDSQKILSAAENFDLEISPVKLNSVDIVKELIELYEDFAKENHVKLKIEDKMENSTFKSDKVVLMRALGNMIKNAIEACPRGKTVKVGAYIENQKINFHIHNPNFIPKKIQLQIFQRSFSTKSPDRGLGTYSMKLLSERYLKGKISFISTKKEGTTFTASYPIIISSFSQPNKE